MKVRAVLHYLSSAWTYYAHVAGVGVIAIGVAWLILTGLSDDGPVVIVVEGPKQITDRVPYRGTVAYTYDARRLQSCPGTTVATFTSITNHGPPATVVIPRPVKSVDIRLYDEARVSYLLPESVFPGKWNLTTRLNSKCPTFERIDQLVSFDFEVTLP